MTQDPIRAALEEAVACIEALRPFPLVMDGVIKGKLNSWQRMLAATPSAPSAEVREPCCPFCGRDPFHYVDNGVGMEAVAVTCCELGDLYYRGARETPETVDLSWDDFAKIGERLSSGLVAPARDDWNEAIEAAAKWHDDQATRHHDARNSFDRYADDQEERNAWIAHKRLEDAHLSYARPSAPCIAERRNLTAAA